MCVFLENQKKISSHFVIKPLQSTHKDDKLKRNIKILKISKTIQESHVHPASSSVFWQYQQEVKEYTLPNQNRNKRGVTK
jgi:hypothetical protein